MEIRVRVHVKVYVTLYLIKCCYYNTIKYSLCFIIYSKKNFFLVTQKYSQFC